MKRHKMCRNSFQPIEEQSQPVNVLSWLVLQIGWRFVIWLLSILGAVLFVAFFLFIHEKSIPKSRRKKRNSLGYMFKEFMKILITIE